MSNKEPELILPGDPRFEATLAGTLPPVHANSDRIFVQRPGSLLLEAVSQSEAEEFCWGGEYDERLAEIEDQDEEAEWMEEDFLTFPTR